MAVFDREDSIADPHHVVVFDNLQDVLTPFLPPAGQVLVRHKGDEIGQTARTATEAGDSPFFCRHDAASI
jgi:hypothetical protein